MSTFNELIDFTRSTTGTYLDSVVYGDELVTNGTFDTDSDWSKGANWSFSEGRATHATGNSGSIKQTVTTVANKKYVLTCEVVSTSSILLIGISSIGQSFTSATGSGVFSFTFTAPDTTSQVEIYQSSGATCIIDNVSVKEVIGGQVSGTPLLRTAAINEPRLEYDASGNPLGLLIEEARTNALLQSGNIGAWSGNVGSRGNVTLTENAITAPDGTQTADKVQRTVLDTPADYRQTKSVVAGNDYTFSIFAKADVQARLELDFSNSKFTSQDYVRFDVDTGTAYNSGTGATYSITNYGNGWYRFSLTATCTVSGSTGVIARIINNEPHYAWGAQFETGSFPTSYIPTSGSTVTRTADVASLPLERFAYNDTKGSIVVSARPLQVGDPSGSQALLEIGTANRSKIYLFARLAGTSQSRFLAKDGSTQADLRSSDFVGGSLSKMSAGWAVNNFAMSMDGGAAVVDTAGAVMTGCTIMGIGTLAMPSTNLINGYIKQIQYYPKRLSNEELELLTQPSASPTMNLTFDGQATSTLVEGLHD